MRRIVVVALLAGFVAGCSGGPNLAQDQASVNNLTAQVRADKGTLSADQETLTGDQSGNLSVPLAGLYVQTDSSGNAVQICSIVHGDCHPLTQSESATYAAAQERVPSDQRRVASDQRRVSADQFKLQVAQDQLKKDEG